MQNYEIPLTYIEYADGIYSLLTEKKNEQPKMNYSFLYIYTLLGFTANRYIVPFY